MDNGGITRVSDPEPINRKGPKQQNLPVAAFSIKHLEAVGFDRRFFFFFALRVCS